MKISIHVISCVSICIVAKGVKQKSACVRAQCVFYLLDKQREWKRIEQKSVSPRLVLPPGLCHAKLNLIKQNNIACYIFQVKEEWVYAYVYLWAFWNENNRTERY